MRAFLLVTIAATVALAAPRRSLQLGHQPSMFVKSDAPKDRSEMSWKEAGHKIPMHGGTFTTGYFYVDMTFGTGSGKVSFKPIVDTGSSNTAIPAVGCTTCGATHFYNSTASPTAMGLACDASMCLNCHPLPVPTMEKPPKENLAVKNAATGEWQCPWGPSVCRQGLCGFEVTYGGGGTATYGNIVTDQACFGDLCANAYIDQFTGQFPPATQVDGILGLAYPYNGCNPTCQPTILDSFVSQGTLKANEDRFGMCLTPGTGGVIDLGGVNSSRYHGDLQYTPIPKKHWYHIEVMDITVNGQSIGAPSFMYAITNDVIGSFVDSGTSIILIGTATYSALSKTVLNNFPTLPHVNTVFGTSNGCAAITNASVIDEYPTIAFVLKGMPGMANFDVSVTGKEYLMPVGGQTYCRGIAGVTSIGAILGDVLMQRYYIDFDRAGGKLGFAKMKSC